MRSHTLSGRWQLRLVFGPALLAMGSACSPVGPQPDEAPRTATGQADAVRCPRGLSRIVRTGGHEDSFASTGNEPARIRPARLPNAYLESIAAAQSGAVQLRDYDEVGSDRVLIDHFDVPRDIVSGAIIVRLRTTGGSVNDVLRLGNMDEHEFTAGFGKTNAYYYGLKKEAANPDAATTGEIVSVPLEALTPNPRADYKGNFIDFLNRADRPDAVDFEVDDDTAVDVAILVVCQRPQVTRGTTFTEFRSKIAAPDVSFLSCFLDKTQAPCNPFEGDRLCTAPLPMACYKPGKRTPGGLEKAGLGQGYSPGGEIRSTPPVAASSFATRGDADRFCTGQFGAGWRILEYHDGAGGAIATYSDIAPKTRLWVDVSDQQYANCWDRTKAR
ncbi:hypothetical protein [Sphingomonas sp. SUN039]|uniref:hypothetical protein n=1 Tax=Sphingomonas sp. SUN039 TaxID=2937787 RepID=UPI0021644454|nr:hypothetical protein [Sphingomonas sp. SUN039]UVO54505.1 hypothetical protein M0209_10375 [Sphingomonas sp. SUN039]